MEERTEVKVLLFGPAREANGGRSEIHIGVDRGTADIAGLRRIMWETLPELRNILESSIFAVNNRMVPKAREETESIVSEGVEIVLVPPVSGG